MENVTVVGNIHLSVIPRITLHEFVRPIVESLKHARLNYPKTLRSYNDCNAVYDELVSCLDSFIITHLLIYTSTI